MYVGKPQGMRHLGGPRHRWENNVNMDLRKGGMRNLGGPRHRWEDNVKMDLRKRGWGGLDWMIWLSIGTSGWLLWTQWWTFRFHKTFGSCLVAAQLTASYEGAKLHGVSQLFRTAWRNKFILPYGFYMVKRKWSYMFHAQREMKIIIGNFAVKSCEAMPIGFAVSICLHLTIVLR
jgi:hypothetical protein